MKPYYLVVNELSKGKFEDTLDEIDAVNDKVEVFGYEVTVTGEKTYFSALLKITPAGLPKKPVTKGSKQDVPKAK